MCESAKKWWDDKLVIRERITCEEAQINTAQVFCEADADTCLSRRLLRDVAERGRDVEGCIKQWFAFVKPNFERYVEPQRKVADIIVPRGIENKVAISKSLIFIPCLNFTPCSKQHVRSISWGVFANTSQPW